MRTGRSHHCNASYVSAPLLYCRVSSCIPYKKPGLHDSTPQAALAMLQHHLLILTLGCLALHVSAVSGLLTLSGRSTNIYLKDSSPRQRRQPATTQQQGDINVVAAPGQQTQNATSTAGKGNGTDPDPGVITNPAVTPISEEVNCSDPTTGRDNKCWEELKLTQWLEDWVDTNVCYEDEAFASCFLRKEGFPGLDCTGIKINACTSPQGENVLKEPEVFYVAYNIYGKKLHHLRPGFKDLTHIRL